jgi:hypothetical protein
MLDGGAGGVVVLPPCSMLLKGGCDMVVLWGIGGGGGWSGEVRERSWSGGTRWYSLGVRSEKAETAETTALMGVGNAFPADVYPERAESLLSGLMMEELGRVDMVDAVSRSSSDTRGRPWGGVMRSVGWPARLYGKESRFAWWPSGGGGGWLLLYEDGCCWGIP